MPAGRVGDLVCARGPDCALWRGRRQTTGVFQAVAFALSRHAEICRALLQPRSISDAQTGSRRGADVAPASCGCGKSLAKRQNEKCVEGSRKSVFATDAGPCTSSRNALLVTL